MIFLLLSYNTWYLAANTPYRYVFTSGKSRPTDYLWKQRGCVTELKILSDKLSMFFLSRILQWINVLSEYLGPCQIYNAFYENTKQHSVNYFRK